MKKNQNSSKMWGGVLAAFFIFSVQNLGYADEMAVESSAAAPKATVEAVGTMRYFTLAGQSAEQVGALFLKAGVTNHVGFVLPSQEGKDQSVAVDALRCTGAPVPELNGFSVKCEFSRHDSGETGLTLQGSDAAVLFRVLRKIGVAMESDPNGAIVLGAQSVTCGNEMILTDAGEKQVYLCKFMTLLR